MDSSVDLGLNSKIVQIRPTVKAVSTKISKFFLYICQYFDISERRLGDIIFPILNIQAKTALIVGLFWNFSFQLTNPHYCP